MDGTKIAYASIDPGLGLPPATERVYVTNIADKLIMAAGDITRSSMQLSLAGNPQQRPAAAWTADGLVGQRRASNGTPSIVHLTGTSRWLPHTSNAHYSVPVDASGRASFLSPDGAWHNHNSPVAVVKDITDAIDEGAFSASPDGSYITYAHARGDEQRDLILRHRSGATSVVVSAPFVAVDGWRADSAAFVLRTGDRAGISWVTKVSWYLLTAHATSPIAGSAPGFVARVVPSPADSNAAVLQVVPAGAESFRNTAWYLTTDAGSTLHPFGRPAIGPAVWSPDGRRIAYTTLSESDIGTGRVRLHVGELS